MKPEAGRKIRISKFGIRIFPFGFVPQEKNAKSTSASLKGGSS